ncbi:hypothetical protein QAD02_005699 [Eretmocerus hayati]|uniref:Uncharacterized protein n=1 Tax=Eretmocerus hayati TaxID=131215 RepID=A0ACC2NTJ6_9HYME|nr:hypothetical protein QAD02_005699 [Eretmocerus hayati]
MPMCVSLVCLRCKPLVTYLNTLSGHRGSIIIPSSYDDMSQHILDRLASRNHDEKLANNYAHDIAQWYDETIATIKPILSTMSRRLYICGLPNTSSGQSIELKAFTKFFVRKYADERGNRIQCASVTQSRECRKGQVDEICSISRSCGGKLNDCTPLDDLKLCESPKEPRYQYYHLSEGSVITGNYGKCHIQGLEVDRYATYVYRGMAAGWGYCHSCKCTCEEGEYLINIEPVYSNYIENMVVTGAKFVMRNNVLEIHVLQAKLLPNGQISNNHQEWLGPQKKTLLKISWDTARKFMLSTKTLPPGYAVTGLKLSYGQANGPKNQDPYIYLQIISSIYDFKSGRLPYKKADVVSAWTPPETELSVADFGSPRKVKVKQDVTLKNEVWVKLTTSNGEDAGYSTIPFFDGQEVTSKRPGPLSGAGLYYKGGKDYAGFIAIELHTYDTANFIAGVPNAQ